MSGRRTANEDAPSHFLCSTGAGCGQILEKIETDYHDIKVDFIINTEKIIKTY